MSGVDPVDSPLDLHSSVRGSLGAAMQTSAASVESSACAFKYSERSVALDHCQALISLKDRCQIFLSQFPLEVNRPISACRPSPFHSRAAALARH